MRDRPTDVAPDAGAVHSSRSRRWLEAANSQALLLPNLDERGEVAAISANASRLLVPLAEAAVRLEPLTEAHREPLRAACAADTEIWEIYPASFHGEHFDASFDAYRATAGRLIFAVLAGGGLVGMTSYLGVVPEHRVLEIGGTYLAPAARRTGINRRMKRLMIEHAIGLGFERIEFRIDTRNAVSMAAVERLGAVREGVMRRQRITWTGYRRDTALYALLAHDWQGP